MLDIAAEVYTMRTLELPIGTYIYCWLEQNGVRIPHSFGQDEYHVNQCLLPGSRLTGLGRRYICQLELDPLTGERPESLPSKNVTVDESSHVSLVLRTNIRELLNSSSPPLRICVRIERQSQCWSYGNLGGRTRYTNNLPELVVRLPLS